MTGPLPGGPHPRRDAMPRRRDAVTGPGRVIRRPAVPGPDSRRVPAPGRDARRVLRPAGRPGMALCPAWMPGMALRLAGRPVGPPYVCP